MFKWVKRIILLILIIVAFIFGVTFTSENAEMVNPVLFGLSLPTFTLGMWLLVMLFLGALIGFVLSIIPNLIGHHSNASKQRKITQLQNELTQLRSLGIKD